MLSRCFAAREERDQIDATLVELDDELASRAVIAAKTADSERVVVRRGDAGDPASFSDVVPVDVLMLCGVFGNVEHATVAETVRAVPAMVITAVTSSGLGEAAHRSIVDQRSAAGSSTPGCRRSHSTASPRGTESA